MVILMGWVNIFCLKKPDFKDFKTTMKSNSAIIGSAGSEIFNEAFVIISSKPIDKGVAKTAK